MGYDNYFTYSLSFPKEDIRKVNELLVKWCDKHHDDLYDSLPGITDDGRLAFYNINYDEWIEKEEDVKDCLFGMRGEYETDYQRNGLIGDEMKLLIDYLKDNNVLVTGYIYTDWDGVEQWCDFWIDSVYKGQFDIDNMATFMLKHLKETA